MKKETNAEFQFLEIPNGEDALALMGAEGIKEYGLDENGKVKDRNHFHNLMEIGICRRGTGTIVLDKKQYLYKKGTVVIIPQNYSHSIISEPGEKSFWEFIYIKPSHFLDKLFKSDLKRRNRYVEEVEYRAFYKERDKILNLVSEIDLVMNQFRVRDYGYRECVQGLLFALIMEIIKINHLDNEKPEFTERVNPQKVEKLSKALEYIEENYEKELRISDIAEVSFVSETYLRRLFAESCATSPMQYVNQVRIEAACKLMKTTDAHINEIAYKVGYDNMATFINNFKRIVGVTPKQWKRNLRQNKEEYQELRKEM